MWRRTFACVVLCFMGFIGWSGCAGTVSASSSPASPGDGVTAERDAQDAVDNRTHGGAEHLENAVNSEEQRRLQNMREAVQETRGAVRGAWDATLAQKNAMVREALENALQNKDREKARQYYDALDTRVLPEAEARTLLVRVLVVEARYAEARQLVRKAADSGDAAALADYWMAFDADPLYGASFVRTITPNGNNSLSALGGGSTVSLKYKEGTETLAAIKPDQDLRQTMYRSEIAYFRICEILGCSFDVPQNVPVRFKREHFNALYAASTSSKNAGYRSKFEHLIWENEEDGRFLYATFKEWINPFVGFPIENVDIWKQIVQPNGASGVDLNALFKRILAASRPSDFNNFNKIKDWTKDLTTTDFARQLSDLMLMDFLTNNWDRFSGAADNYGANCHIHPGGIIAIDNGAAFPAWHAPRVVKRLEFVHVFHRDFVRRLRMITPEMINDRLFPNATKEEKKSLQRFWERRDQALKHIDAQISRYGEAAVLAF